MVVKIPNPGRAALGKNAINIILDVPNDVQEAPSQIGEANNDLSRAYSLDQGFCFFIFDNSVQPIHPPNFGIVGQSNITLSASSSNALANEAFFQFQIDTTESFNSPSLLETEILSNPGLIRWEPNILSLIHI